MWIASKRHEDNIQDENVIPIHFQIENSNFYTL
jgi:hypothetical protein